MEKDKSILLIDDSDVDNFINKRLIELIDKNISVKIFKDGRTGLTYLKQLNNIDDLPELIFLDLNMPVLDGLGFLNEYRLMDNNIKLKIKIVVLTSSSNPVDFETLKVLGFNDHLTKPLTDAILKEKLKEVYGGYYTTSSQKV